MKHTFYHLHDGAIRTLHHSILLKPIRDGRLLLNVIILQKSLEYLGNEHLVVVRLKRLDFVLWLRIFKCLELLELLKVLSFGLQRIQPHLHWEIIDEGYKISCNAHECSLHEATNIIMCNLQRLGCSPLPSLKYVALCSLPSETHSVRWRIEVHLFCT